MLKKQEYAAVGETVYTGETSSGLGVTVVQKPGYRKSMAFLAVNYGSSHREFKLGRRLCRTPAGTAHFVEHRLFEVEGGDNALTTLSERGANANAFTSPDMTAYHFECTDFFYENLALLLNFVSTPYFTQEDVERERAIIAREILSAEDDPEDAVYYGLLRCLFETPALRENVAGSVESIGEITAQTLLDAHRAFYVPGNMALVVAGDRDPARILDMAEELMPGSPAPAPVKLAGPPEGPLPVTVSARRPMDVGAPLFLAGAKAKCDLTGPESVRFELTANLALSSLLGEASPLYRELYDGGTVNETFGYDFENTWGASMLSFGGETQKPEYVCMRVLEEAAKLAAGGIDPDFFQRRKRAALGSALRALDSFETVCYNAAAGRFAGYDYFDTVKVLEEVTAEDARAFLAEYMALERCAISIVDTKG